MPGRRTRGEGTSKVSVRQGMGYAGALPTALSAHRVPFKASSRWRIVRGRRIMPARGGSASSVLPRVDVGLVWGVGDVVSMAAGGMGPCAFTASCSFALLSFVTLP